MTGISENVLSELAPTGVIRTAINLGNPVLAQKDAATGALQGVSVALAREVGRRLGVEVVFQAFESAGKVFEVVPRGTLDLMFLAIDPVRAEEILFTAPYVVIEGTYLVCDDSPLRDVMEFDREGVRIAVGKGAAYDLYLSRALKHAALERAATSAAAIDLFVDEGLEAAAGVRQPLLAYAASHPGFRVIDGRFTAIEQAVGVPKGREAARAWLQEFVEEVKASGFVAAALAASGQTAASVAPAQARWPEV
ncbi:transporter substrate-binding domain-containing protein [Acetobacter fallax]|uniref:Transporter substrate-binding domain-containing protein n=1 Tax=Acetobacter fallax TaxID=1737473 RepID=A0ABX0K4W7_9PROT|nr:transporter substrate-binding domain-containing protein [Acetobacter fallax]NHO31420.1 transporter substrate-binding domain-containing protein [Acetobacter fallax]NHO34998.1 transporter substrate-binding domain-containing protein [Acetobacter fallax]